MLQKQMEKQDKHERLNRLAEREAGMREYRYRYYFPHKKGEDVFLFIDSRQPVVEGWAFYEFKGKRVYASELHEKKYEYVWFEYDYTSMYA